MAKRTIHIECGEDFARIIENGKDLCRVERDDDSLIAVENVLKALGCDIVWDPED